METFSYTFDNEDGTEHKTYTIEIPAIFKSHVTLVEHFDAYYGNRWKAPHIDTTEFLATFIRLTAKETMTPEQLGELYAKYEEACKWLVETKQEALVTLGVEQMCQETLKW